MKKYVNHSLCNECYQKLEPGRDPTRVREGPREICCLCGERHRSGIYYRGAADEFACKGECAKED